MIELYKKQHKEEMKKKTTKMETPGGNKHRRPYPKAASPMSAGSSSPDSSSSKDTRCTPQDSIHSSRQFKSSDHEPVPNAARESEQYGSRVGNSQIEPPRKQAADIATQTDLNYFIWDTILWHICVAGPLGHWRCLPS